MLAGFAALTVVDLYVLDAKLINPRPIAQMTQQFEPDATVRRLQQEGESSLFRVLPVWALTTPDNTMDPAATAMRVVGLSLFPEASGHAVTEAFRTAETSAQPWPVAAFLAAPPGS